MLFQTTDRQGAAGPSGQIFPDTASPLPTWRWLWPVLALAFVVRLAFATWADAPVHPDEIFQYLEPAHRLTHGYGIVTWEYIYGIRSWFIPLCIAGLLTVADWIGLSEPWLYGPFVEAVLCLISLTLPVGMYRLTQRLASERVAIAALFAGCFWHNFLYFAHKPMPGILATYGLVWICVWMLNPPTRARLLAVGGMAGLVLMLRYQLLPAVGILGLLALFRLRFRAIPAIAGLALGIVSAGLLDLVFWGGFLSSYIDNFRLNFSYDISSLFGREGPLFLSWELMKESTGLVALAGLGIALCLRRLWPFALAVLVGYLAFHIPAHKEFRFVVWTMPFVLIAACLPLGWPPLARTRVLPAFVLGWMALGTLYQSTRDFGVGTTARETLVRDSLEVTRALARMPGITGVGIDAPDLPAFRIGGYYALHRPVPVRFSEWPGSAELDPDLLSHRVVAAGTEPPPGYDIAMRVGSFDILARDTPGPALTPVIGAVLAPLSPALPEDFVPFGKKVPLLSYPETLTASDPVGE